MAEIDPKVLERGDGQEGRPVLVSVQGKVYDVSKSALWSGGEHMHSHHAGRDLSLALQAAPHGADVLERFEAVGEVAAPTDAAPTVLPRPTGLVATILTHRPHPVSVHFPIALGVVAAAFLAASLVLDRRILELAALLDLAVAVLFVPPAILAGLLSWRFNYGGIWTPTFFRKAVLSSLLLCLSVAALVIRLGVIGVHGTTIGPWWWGYVALVLVHVPVVMGLGYLGGRIAFPR
ncbi:MAG: cytochrome b5 [Deltaproteobacteria bacterium]|nr:cytochrome b5 [Deltaproteobacteria bacterium]